MLPKELLSFLGGKIISSKASTPFIVGINGIDGSGKTYFAKQLYNYMCDVGYDVELISIDDFLNNRSIRYQKGKDSPEGFYYDSYNYKEFIQDTLLPFSKGGGMYCKSIFDVDRNRTIERKYFNVRNTQILIVEGIFLFRKELLRFFNYKIFLDVTFKEALQRNIHRQVDLSRIGSRCAIEQRYKNRYRPGQELYFSQSHPKTHSDIIIDNNDFNNPIVIEK